MVIKKHNYTPQEQAELDKLYLERKAILENISKQPKGSEDNPAIKPLYLELDRLTIAISDIWEATEQRYILSFKKDPKLVIKDAKEILAAATEEDFKQYSEAIKDNLAEEDKDELTKYVFFLGFILDAQLQVARFYNDRATEKKLTELITKKINSSFKFTKDREPKKKTELAKADKTKRVKGSYSTFEQRHIAASKAHPPQAKPLPPTFKPAPALQPAIITTKEVKKALEEQSQQPIPPYRPMYYGAATTAITQITKRTPTEYDNYTGKAVITIDNGNTNVEIQIDPEYFTTAKGLKFSTIKLLEACIIKFTSQNNHIKGTAGKGKAATRKVRLPLNEYMKYTNTPNTKASKDELRKTIKEDIKTLYSYSIKATEIYKGEVYKWEMRLLEGKGEGVKSGDIAIEFTEKVAIYLLDHYIMQYPTALFKLGEWDQLAYHIGKKLFTHYSNDSNQAGGTADIIAVKTLLQNTDILPTYEEEIKSGGHIKQRIITPFNKALTTLIDTEVIASWEYCNSKKTPLRKEQDPEKYQTFIDLFITFTVKDYPDQTARLTAKAERIEEAKAKKKKPAKKIK